MLVVYKWEVQNLSNVSGLNGLPLIYEVWFGCNGGYMLILL